MRFYYWRMARLAELIEDRERAVRYYTRILTDVKRPGNGYAAQVRLRNLGVDPPPLPDPFKAPPDTPPPTRNEDASL